MVKYNINYILIIFSILVIASCTEEVGPKDVKGDTFFKQYSTSVSESNTYVGKTSNGFIMAGLALTNDQLFISHCNETGELDWQKEIPIDRTVIFPQGLKLSDGSFIINDFNNPIITKIDENGDVAYSKWIYPTLTAETFVYSPLFESDNGMCYVTYSAGGGTGSFDFNFLTEIDPSDGSATKTIRYFDRNFGGKIIRFNIMKVQDTTFWVSGNVLTGNPYSWADPFKLFTAKFSYYEVFNLKVYDDGSSSEEKELATVATKDNNIVLVTSRSHFIYDADAQLAGPNVFKVRKIDLELNDLWEQTIDIGVNSIYPLSIEEGDDGNLVVSGTCVGLNQNKTSGFVAKLNNEGVLIKSRVFNLGQQHHILDAKYLPDHSFFFTGYIENFGKGKEKEDRFYLKTDEDFNY